MWWLLTVLVGVLLLGTESPRIVAAADERVYETAHFSITWVHDPSDPDAPDLTDADSSGVPDAVESLGEAFEFAWDFEIGELGYQPPPVEGHYPVYVSGSAVEGVTRKSPGGTGRSSASFIVVSASFVATSTPEWETNALAVHEFFHAIQFGYDADEHHWIREATATWMEDIALDEFDPNHLWLPSFIPEPRRSLLVPGSFYEYGAFIFFQFLTERYGDVGMVKDLWEAMAAPDAIPGAPDLDSGRAIEAVLAARSIDLSEAWAEFLLWRYRLRKFDEGTAYAKLVARRIDWPQVLRSTRVRAESCRLTSEDENRRALPALSGDYVALKPHRKGPMGTKAQLTVRGPAGSGAFYLMKLRGTPVSENPLTFDAEGVATADIEFGRRRVRRVTVGLGNGAVGGAAATLEYSLRLSGMDRVEASPPSGATATTYGTGVQLSGTISCRRRPAALAHVLITEREIISGGERTFSTATDELGGWRIGITPEANSTYSVEVVDPLLSGARAGGHEVRVQVAVTMEVERERIPAGTPVSIHGRVTPAHPGASVVVEYRRPGASTWSVGAEATVGATGDYSTQFPLPGEGIWELRARVPTTGDRDHDPGGSGTRLVDVVG
jgi:hypothetical protein